jgi:CheY-like chemotaxis protein
MNDVTVQPLILIADDDEEFRERAIPQAMARLTTREPLKAKNVEEACLLAAEHDDASAEPLDLIILDMHMPLDENTITPAKDAGIRFLRGNQLTLRPVIVFTAYPSYGNCVLAMQAGAAAYLPKKERDTYEGTEGGIDQLVETCRRLLTKAEPGKTHHVPDEAWLGENYEWLCQEFADRWVAFVPSEKASTLGITGTERAGLTIISDESRENLVRVVAKNLPRLGEIPLIVFVPGGGVLAHEPQEET